ncbi:16095_t:CDS:1, partial [Cetraspora pellucida]
GAKENIEKGAIKILEECMRDWSAIPIFGKDAIKILERGIMKRLGRGIIKKIANGEINYWKEA